MDAAYEKKYHQMEERHWWFAARRDMVYRLIKAADRGSAILDIGCSGGALLNFLSKKGFGDLYGVDRSSEAVDICLQRKLDVFWGEATEMPFDDGIFDMAIASDTLEHINNEEEALSEWRRVLRPEGKLIIFVPAFDSLWSEHDEINQHYRRYTKTQLRTILEENGFKVIRSGYWNFLLFFPAFLIRQIKRKFPKKDGQKRDELHKLPALLNVILIGLLKLENCILEKINFPLGVSVFAVAEK